MLFYSTLATLLLASYAMASDSNQAAVVDDKRARNLRVSRDLWEQPLCEYGYKKDLKVVKICATYDVDGWGYLMEVHLKIDGSPYWPMSVTDCSNNGFTHTIDDGVIFCEIPDEQCTNIEHTAPIKSLGGHKALTITMIEEDNGGDDSYTTKLASIDWCVPTTSPYEVTVYHSAKSNIQTESCLTISGEATVSAGAGVSAEVGGSIESKKCSTFDEPDEYIAFYVEVSDVEEAA